MPWSKTVTVGWTSEPSEDYTAGLTEDVDITDSVTANLVTGSALFPNTTLYPSTTLYPGG